MKLIGPFPGAVVPARRGWYLRDHRAVAEYIHDTDRRFCVDLWEPDNDPRSNCYPGVWYVCEGAYAYRNQMTGAWVDLDGINDASQQQLPWYGLAEPLA